MEPKRLFIALPVDGFLKEKALEWQANHSIWPVRWLKPEDFHLTVISPWLETDLESLISKLDKFVESPREAVDFKISKIVFGPNRFNPRLVWGEGRAPVSLLELKNRLEQALARPDDRFYRLHLTLGRFASQDFGPQGLPHLFDSVDWGQKVKIFSLFESEIGPDGPIYRRLKDFEFSF